MKNNDKDQGVTETPEYIIVTVSSDSKLIMPIKKGIKFMETWAGATEIYQKWSSEPQRLRGVDKDFEVKFISGERLKEMKMASLIGADTDDDKDT